MSGLAGSGVRITAALSGLLEVAYLFSVPRLKMACPLPPAPRLPQIVHRDLKPENILMKQRGENSQVGPGA